MNQCSEIIRPTIDTIQGKKYTTKRHKTFFDNKHEEQDDYWEIVAHSAYDMLSFCKYFIVQLSFPPRFWSGDFFLIAPFRDHC